MGRPAPRSEVTALLYRPAEVAVMLGVSRSRAYEMIASGEIPSVRVGGTSPRVPRESLDNYLAALHQNSSGAA